MFRQSLLAAAILTALALDSSAEDADTSPVPAAVTFVVSTGFWEETAEPEESEGETPASDAAATPVTRRGYYKLVALRQADGTAEVHLQQIEATSEGPKIVTTTELDEFTRMKPFVTDIRPENSAGITAQPGLFATVYLKTDPATAEPDSWTVLIDDLGDIKIERATN